jgi:hypothetical protein
MSADDSRFEGYIARAKATNGGHLHIVRGGFTLCYGSSRLSGYGPDHIKALCIDAELPVIDGRPAPIDLVAKISVSGPMIALNAEPDPHPRHALSYAPLGAVAAAYRKTGAEVFNIEESSFDERGLSEQTHPSLADLIDGWLAYV